MYISLPIRESTKYNMIVMIKVSLNPLRHSVTLMFREPLNHTSEEETWRGKASFVEPSPRALATWPLNHPGRMWADAVVIIQSRLYNHCAAAAAMAMQIIHKHTSALLTTNTTSAPLPTVYNSSVSTWDTQVLNYDSVYFQHAASYYGWTHNWNITLWTNVYCNESQSCHAHTNTPTHTHS